MSFREEIEQLAVEHGWFVEKIGVPVKDTSTFTYAKGTRIAYVDWTPTGRLSGWGSNSTVLGWGGWGRGGKGKLIAYIVDEDEVPTQGAAMENLPPVHRLPGGYGCQIYSLPPYADTGARNAALGAVLINLHHKMLGTWPQAETVVAMIEAFTGEKLEKP